MSAAANNPSDPPEPDPVTTALAKRESSASVSDREQVTKLLGKLVEKIDDPAQLIELTAKFLGTLSDHEATQIKLAEQRNQVAIAAEERRSALAINAKKQDPDAIELREGSSQLRWLRGSLIWFAILCISGGLACLYFGAATFALLLFGVATFCVVMVSVHGTDGKLNVDDSLRALKAAGDMMLKAPELPPADTKEERKG